jgi:hypothetical protein
MAKMMEGWKTEMKWKLEKMPIECTISDQIFF